MKSWEMESSKYSSYCRITDDAGYVGTIKGKEKAKLVAFGPEMLESFIAMFKIVDVVITEDDQPPVEMCEDYLKALKVYNHVTGENHRRTRIEQIVNQHYDIP